MCLDYPSFDGTQSCHGAAGDLARAFAGAAGVDPTPAQTRCTGCPFLEVCRDYALTHDTYGVWGGTTEQDREQLRAQMGLPAPDIEDLDAAVLRMRETSTITMGQAV